MNHSVTDKIGSWVFETWMPQQQHSNIVAATIASTEVTDEELCEKHTLNNATKTT